MAQAESGRHRIQKYFILDVEWKHRYDRVTYPSFVDKFYQDNEYEVEPMEYEDYLEKLDNLVLGNQPAMK